MTRLRLLLVPAALLLAVASILSAIGGISRLRAPELVLKVAPDDPVARIRSIERKLMQSGNPEQVIRQAAMPARAALRAEPLKPSALRLLALADFLDAKTAAGVDLLSLSQRISRHDLGTRLTLIEHYAASGNVAAALDQYDLALTTSRAADDILLPVLMRALSERDIRAGLGQYVQADRLWLRGFIGYATANADPPDNLARMIIASGGLPRHPDYRVFETTLLSQLYARKRYDMLRTYFLSLPGRTPAYLRDVTISQETVNPALRPLSWNLVDTPEISAQGDSDVEIRIASSASGIAMQRILYLGSGTYRFGARVTFPEGEGGATWELRCLTTGSNVLWQSEISPGRDDRAPETWNIPVGCGAQLLTFVVTSGQNSADTVINVSNLTLS